MRESIYWPDDQTLTNVIRQCRDSLLHFFEELLLQDDYCLNRVYLLRSKSLAAKGARLNRPPHKKHSTEQ